MVTKHMIRTIGLLMLMLVAVTNTGIAAATEEGHTRTRQSSTIMRHVSAAATCACSGAHKTDWGTTTVTLWRTSCEADRIADVLATSSKVSDILRILGVDIELPGFSVLRKIAEDIRRENAVRTGVQIKLSIKLTGPRYRVSKLLPYNTTRVDGFIDSPKPNEVLARPVLVRGWARVQGTCLERIELIIDGTLRPDLPVTIGGPRADAGPGAVAWSVSWPARKPGPHTISVRVVPWYRDGSGTLLRSAFAPIDTIAVNVP